MRARWNITRRRLKYSKRWATIKALAQCYLNIANALSRLDRFDESQTMYENSEQISRRLSLDELRRQAVYNKAYLLFLRGQFRQALALLFELREKFSETGSQRHAALCDLDCAELYLQMSLPAEADKWLAGLWKRSRRSPSCPNKLKRWHFMALP
jgi:tetratricopeptide (TPR) repeat protein